eukprot:CCRYP_013813-RA/>CCRYP_013813-RA protein AED:0.38 eAED:0.38 QI:0/-1/0/1/-1/1/1/0/702
MSWPRSISAHVALSFWAGSLLIKWPTAHCENRLIANPSTGTNILFDDSLFAVSVSRISITSNIPVTIQRYADTDGNFVVGSQPVSASDVRVVVTSDCDTTETSVIPTVELDEGSIDVKLNVTEDANMTFLEPSWYQAFWSYMSFWCPELTTTVASVDLTENISANDAENDNGAVDTAAQSGSASPSSTSSNTTAAAGNSTSSSSTSSANTAAASDGTSSTEDDAVATDDTMDNMSTGDEDTEPSPNSTHRRSFLLQTMTTFVMIFLASVLLFGVNGNINIFGFGKVAVAAIAVSFLFSKASRNQNRSQDPSRKLQTCTYNVDILLDGCYYSLDINAPSARIIDAVLVNLTSADSREQICTTDYSALLTFPVSENNTELKSNTTVTNVQCDLIAEGRPFVDSSGKNLFAPHNVDVEDLSWSGYLAVKDTSKMSSSRNETLSILGDEWIRRALAEHASIASFAAFSIALMTNKAPSILVEDALKAGLDEVRHAKVSFGIASMLTGNVVGPGPLPSSNIDFKQDLVALALAVAKEGCVDETLSTFSAVLEASIIQEAIVGGVAGTKYSHVDHNTLTLMRDELQKIAMDESRHSALAWRTLNWLCGVDPDACSAVQNEVFQGKLVKQRIGQIVDNKNHEATQLLLKEWTKILIFYGFNKTGLDYLEHGGVANEQPSCDSVNYEDVDLNGLKFISLVTATIQGGVVC